MDGSPLVSALLALRAVGRSSDKPDAQRRHRIAGGAGAGASAAFPAALNQLSGE
ncbi:MAG: hypothetical protein H6954_13410 [Chromatiaceae bacterium]|nr:hypothetical protein [Chromatiaceae bacterium]